MAKRKHKRYEAPPDGLPDPVDPKQIVRNHKGQFAPGHAANPRGYASSFDTRLRQFTNELAELTDGGKAVALELWKIARGAYGAQAHHRIQALEIIANRLLGKVADQHVVQTMHKAVEERPYAALSADVLEALIRGLPAPLSQGEVVDAQLIEPESADPAEAPKPPNADDDSGASG